MMIGVVVYDGEDDDNTYSNKNKYDNNSYQYKEIGNKKPV